MEEFQLSVFYQGAFLSYGITTEDAVVFHFTLKSAPQGSLYAPDHFVVLHKDESWEFDTLLETGFKKSVVHTLKKARV